MSFELRPATAEDLPAIDAVELASARVAFAHIGPVDQLKPDPEKWRPWLNRAETALVALDARDEVVGFAFGGECELLLFYTHPRVWGMGAGRALLAAVEDGLRETGCAEAFVYTESRNHRPLRVYEAAGWLPDGATRERNWLGAELRELRLRKRLTSPEAR